MKKILSVVLLSSFASLAPLKLVYAGIPVVDPSTIKTLQQTIKQYEKQIEQYATQLKQYEIMVRDQLAPTAWLWNETQKTIENIQGYVNKINTLKENLSASSGADFMERFKSIEYYKNSECFNDNTCHQVSAESFTENSKIIEAANQDLTLALKFEREAIVNDTQNLRNIQRQAESAQGQLQAIQAANQLASAQANQLLQMRQIATTQMEATLLQQQTEADKNARIEAMQQRFFEPAPIKNKDARITGF